MCKLVASANPVSVTPFTADKTIDANKLYTGSTGGCAMPTGCKMEHDDGSALTAAESDKIAIDANGKVTLTHTDYPTAAEHKLRADCGGTKSAIITVAA